MQFTTLSLALLAGVATATQGHFHPKRVTNGTTSAVPDQTTMTVYATAIRTITSCAASITNCPARASGVAGATGASASPSMVVITDTIVLATTICPVTEADKAKAEITGNYYTAALSSFSAKVSSAAISGSFYGATTTLAPAASATSTDSGDESTPVSSGAGVASVIPQTVTGEASHTLTYTLGAGSSTTVVTTTIVETEASTIYATVFPTETVYPVASTDAGDSPQATTSTEAAVSPSSGAGSYGGYGSGDSTTIQTTTIYGTSTSTHYITVSAVAPSSAATGLSGIVTAVVSSADDSSSPTSSTDSTYPSDPAATSAGSLSGVVTSSCPDAATVTVTTTIAAPTVYVTVGSQCSTSSAPAEAASTDLPEIKTAIVASSATSDAAGAMTTPAPSDPAVIISIATVIPIPATASISSGSYYGNGTATATKKKSKCASSGFLTSKSRPTGYVTGTGYASPTGY
ncbi:hypothetical protein NHQ30_008453 [Ciborinia camelliae]|nr:hypothetical protein NHQ30_008453 [Ciborinia camelliae]